MLRSGCGRDQEIGSGRLIARGLLLLAALGLPILPARGAGDDGGRAPNRPNVLFVAIDDLNDWTGFLDGHPGTKTPNLDRLAARGEIFTRAYCSAPACNPSRASLLCGVRPSTSGVYHNDQPWRPVLRDAVTLPQHFMAAGYEVVAGGKLFHNSYNDLASWQHYEKTGPHPEPERKPVNGIPNAAHFDWGPVDVSDDEMGDARVIRWAANYLSRSHDKPFFLAVGLIRPHLPWYVPRTYFDRFPLSEIVLPTVKEDDLDDIPPLGLKMARPEGDHRRVVQARQWEKAVQGYLASIHFADAMIGRLLQALDASPDAQNTIVVLWGDHGWHLGEKKHWRKFALWEEATRVPLIIVAPGWTRPGTRCERTVSLLDLYPTLIELCGLPPKKGLEGDSIARLLKDPAAEWDRPVVTTHGRGNHAVRSERWRYIRYNDGTEELYDHQADPLEWTNRAKDPALAEVKSRLAAWLPKQDAPDAPRDKKKQANEGE
ncbi:MAG: sulfatase [Isosphaeraceae bacterium]|nr:sulfatase [Isosphaeraceae bacterium]